QQPCGGDGPAVVGEAGRARVGELAHLGQLLPALPLRDGGEEPGRYERLLARPLDERGEHRGVVDDGVRVRHREDGAVAARRRRRRPRGDRLLVLAAGRAQVDVRVDEGGRDDEAGRAGRLEADDHPLLDRDAQALVDALHRVDHPSLEHERAGAAVAAGEHHVTPAATGAGVAATVSRSYSTAMRTTSPERTCSVTSAASESATRGSISTPRFIGPGCITTCPRRTRSGVIAQRAAYSRSEGTKASPGRMRSLCMRSA